MTTDSPREYNKWSEVMDVCGKHRQSKVTRHGADYKPTLMC
jgi:hypothetical protein